MAVVQQSTERYLVQNEVASALLSVPNRILH